MADLEFISTISSTFIDEINKFITTFTSTIKTQFEDIENKVKAQDLEITKLKEELNSKKYEEKNYTSVSVIKNQDKQIHEQNNTIKTLENRLKYLEQKVNNNKEPIKSIIEDKKSNDIVVEHMEVEVKDKLTNESLTTNNKIEESLDETQPEPIIVKKTVKKVSKKNSVESNSSITPTNETITEKPKRKIALKKAVKNELTVSTKNIEKEKPEAIPDIELEKEHIEKEKPEVLLDIELEKEHIEKEHIEKEQATTIKTEQIDIKTEKKSKTSTTGKKDTKTHVEIKKEEEPLSTIIEVKYPDSIPLLDSVNILELDNIDYYLDEITNNVFQITPDEDIGAFIGVYDKDNTKIIKMSL